MGFVKFLTNLNIGLFSAFIFYTLYEGITKQSVYDGRIGLALYAFLVMAALIAVIQTYELLTMFFTKDPLWGNAVLLVSVGWIVVIITSSTWMQYIISQFK